jgi:hypothetical protein
LSIGRNDEEMINKKDRKLGKAKKDVIVKSVYSFCKNKF